MPRAGAILGRFPAHMEADKPGKLIGHVVGALSRQLDDQSLSMASIRRAHRLFETEEEVDLLRLGALFGVAAGELEVALERFRRARALLRTLVGTVDGAERRELAEELLATFGIDEEPRLARFVPDGMDPDDLGGAAGDAALSVVEKAVAAALANDSRLRTLQSRVAQIAFLHHRGNATVRTLMEAAANALDLDMDAISHSGDRFAHAGLARDRIELAGPAGVAVPAGKEVLGLVENPLQRIGTDESERRHGELFPLRRRGFGPVRLQARVTGGDRGAFGPMVVDRDRGRGLGFAGRVAPGETVVFADDGRVRLGSNDVTAMAYAFEGACFADGGTPDRRDFVFDDDRCRFARGFPTGALDRDFAFPHAGSTLPALEVDLGVTRMAFFTARAHYATQPDPESAATGVTPRPFRGVFDASTFGPAAGGSEGVAALVAFSWLEHEGYKVRIVIPPRFRRFDDDAEGSNIRRRVAQALERFRAAGVQVEVVFDDDRFVVGEAILSAAEVEDPLDAIRGGTRLWSAPASDGG